jgi:hypothetical protein
MKKHLAAILNWFSELRIEASRSKFVHTTFTIRSETYPPVHINNIQLPGDDVRYLGLRLDRRLT